MARGPPEPGRRPRIEILEPHPELKLLRVSIHRQRTGPSPIAGVCILVLLFMLWRLKLGPLPSLGYWCVSGSLLTHVPVAPGQLPLAGVSI